LFIDIWKRDEVKSYSLGLNSSENITCNSIFYPSIGGIEKVTLDLCRQLINKGYKCDVVTLNRFLTDKSKHFLNFEEVEGINGNHEILLKHYLNRNQEILMSIDCW